MAKKKKKLEPYPKLGAFDFEQKNKVSYIPRWIEKGTVVSRDIQNEKAELDAFSDYLSPPILDRLRRRGLTHLFPVQKLLIPELLEPFRRAVTCALPPRDICVSAPTGSGKTLSYVLPVLEILTRSEQRRRSPWRHAIRALIVLPVVDLAKQVCEVFRSFLEDGSSLRVALLTGQQELETEIRNVYEVRDDGCASAAVDIVVATPGRLLEHLTEGGGAFDLRYLRFLVIDEADRLLSDYRIDWFKAVEGAVYSDLKNKDEKRTVWFFGEKRMVRESFTSIQRHRPNAGNVKALFEAGRYPLQKIFLSATLSYDPGQLQRLNLFRPKLFKAQTLQLATEEEGAGSAPERSTDGGVVLPAELKEYCLTCSSNLKPLAVFCLLSEHESDWKRILCFVQSRQTSRRLATLLAALGMENAKEASAALTRMRRQKLLKKFAAAKIRVLICSDLLARGIDIADVDCVINYDPPRQMLAYVHRAGRTARAGCTGSVVTIADENEITGFTRLMQTSGRWGTISQLELPKERFKVLRSKYREALAQLKDVVEAQKRNVKQRRFRKRPKERPTFSQRAKKARTGDQ